MKIDVRVFDLLDGIARSYKISDIEWAEAAEIRRPTIPELRRLSRVVVRGGDQRAVKRACTLEKILKLYAGLRVKVGDPVVKEALRNFIETERDQNLRLQLLLLMLRYTKAETKDEAETMLRSVLKAAD